MRRLAIATIVLASGLAVATPAEASDNAGPTTTSIKVTDTAKVVTATTVVSGPDTTPPKADTDDDDDDSDKTGLWGLLGLLGLAGLAGLKRKRDDNYPTGGTGGTRVNADTTPRGSTSRP